MKIEAIRLKNFKVFRQAAITDIPAFCVIIGANGAGKSTLLDVFSFIKDCLAATVSKALQTRGGYREVVSRGMEGEGIRIEMDLRMRLNEVERSVTYQLEIGPGEHGRPAIEQETLSRQHQGAPVHLLNFQRGRGFVVVNEESFAAAETLQREEQVLNAPDVLALKGLGQFQRFQTANLLREFIENWNIADFHVNLARGIKDATGYAEHLSSSGDNLQLAANHLYENHRATFDLILQKMRQRIPGMGQISPERTPDGRLLLKFQDGSFADPFIDRYVSDGTLKMFAYLILLHDPAPHPLLWIEEPENQVYPRLLWELAEEFRAYALRGGQVFVSTHSPDFLNATQLDEVFWLVKRDGYSQARRARNDPQLKAYMEAGDQMGYLWKEGFFEGADPQ